MADPESPLALYKHPPITEAVIGINFLSPIKVADFNSVYKKFNKYYPSYQAVSSFDVAVELSDQTDKTITNVGKSNGHRLATADMTQLLLMWPSTFTLSQLAPYEGWDHFFERFVRDWSVWKRVAGFRTICRIGVRYINRIDIPATGPITRYEESLNIYPRLPDILDPISAYAIQISSPLNAIGCQLILNSAVVPSPILDHSSFVIDLDISKEVDLPQSDKDIYDLLNKIRVQKNVIFEACINDQARKLFQ